MERFFAGIKYSEKKAETVNKPETVQTQTESSEGARSMDLISVCGDMPNEAYPPYGHYNMRTGPEWSPDCRYIAWGMWESGTSYLGDDPEILKQFEKPRQLSGKEGIFLYRDSNKAVTKIYSPKELSESPQFIGWTDSQNLTFKVKQVEYNYNLLSKETTPVN